MSHSKKSATDYDSPIEVAEGIFWVRFHDRQFCLQQRRASAAHHYPQERHSGHTGHRQPPIGTRDLRLVDEQVVLPKENMKLTAGDKLLFCTDGVFEYQNQQREFYGSAPLHRKLKELKDRPVSDLVGMLFESLMEFGNGAEPKDDISLLGIKFKP